MINEYKVQMQKDFLEPEIYCVCDHRQFQHYIGRGQCDFCIDCKQWRAKYK